MSTFSISYIKEKWGHIGFQKYFKNTGWLFAAKITTLSISFFVGIAVARYLGPTNYGSLNYVLSFVGLFGFISSLGIDNILSRELINSPEKRDSLLGTSFVIKIVGSLLALAITVSATFATNNTPFLRFVILLVSSSYIFQAFGVIDNFFQANVKAKSIAIAQLVAYVISAILKLVFIFLGFGFSYFALMYSVDYILLATTLIYLYRKQDLKIFKWKFEKSLAVQLLKNSWPLIISTAFYFVYMRIDQIMLKQIIDEKAVGIYSVGVKLSEVWYFVPSMIISSIFPAIVNAKKSGDAKMYENRLKKFYSLFIWLPILFLIPTIALAPQIIRILFGAQYMEAVSILQIYVWSGISISLGMAVSQFLITENYIKIMMFSTCLGAMANIVLNLLLIPRMGTVGAAIASLVSYTLVPMSIIFFKQSRGQIRLIIKGFLFKFN